MGRGIALAALTAGLEVWLYDNRPEATEEASRYIKEKINTWAQRRQLASEHVLQVVQALHVVDSLEHLKGQFVIEAIVEDLAAKQQLFQRLAAHCDPSVIFCTNTSSIPVMRIAEGVPHPQRVVGMHFFNPADRITLVEVVATSMADPRTVDRVVELAQRMGKVPIRVKDVPGFVVNRIGKMYHTEPLYLLENQVAEVADVDDLLEAAGFRMGPFRLIDLIGVDANLNVTRSLFQQLGEERFRPSALQEQMVLQGRLGRKAAKGFYDYSDKKNI